jgi:hypothetical protein
LEALHLLNKKISVGVLAEVVPLLINVDPVHLVQEPGVDKVFCCIVQLFLIDSKEGSVPTTILLLVKVSLSLEMCWTIKRLFIFVPWMDILVNGGLGHLNFACKLLHTASTLV